MFRVARDLEDRLSSTGEGRVSVVVVTRNRLPELLVTLAHLRALPERPRVVVVDNASSDGTAAEVRRRHPEVEVVALEENLGAAARNVGVGLLGTPYVAFSDDDSWWEPGALRRAAELLDAHPRLALLAGRILVGPEGREDPICAEMRRSPLPREPDLPGPPVLGFLACASVVRREAYLSAGGFDPHVFFGGEEELLAADLAAAGWALVYVEEVVCRHHPSTFRDRRRRRRLGIRNALWFAWMRRPAGVAARQTLEVARSALRDPDAGAALIEALGGLPRRLSSRRVLPPSVEEGLEMLDRERGFRALGAPRAG